MVTRKNLLDQLSDEDREFAIDLSTEKLSKFVSRQVKLKVETNEAFSRPMPENKVNPFTEMTKDQRQNNWSKVLENYTKRQYRKVVIKHGIIRKFCRCKCNYDDRLNNLGRSKIAELSGNAKSKDKPTRTEEYIQYTQGQSIDLEIIDPRGRDKVKTLKSYAELQGNLKK